MRINNDQWVKRSLSAVWHPCTQMKHHEQWPLVPIARGEGVWLYDMEGRRYLDAVSSWWTNLFGHANPRINAVLKQQLDTLEHAMLAGFTHQPVIELSERLRALTGLGHAFYASDGASAVEIALKMSFHYWRNAGHPRKQHFISLQGSYHGETIGALSVTDVAIFRDAYAPLVRNNLLVPAPNQMDTTRCGEDGCCSECVEPALVALRALLLQRADEIAALIVEPLVQGANGMRMYHADYLRGARRLCDEYRVHFICDEIMTGFGRTGTMFAHEQAGIKPDLLCLSKGISGGYLPLSVTLCTDDIYAAFYDDDATRGFLHSHSYTGNALACRAACTVLDIFEQDDVIRANAAKRQRFNTTAAPLKTHSRVRGFRNLGMIWAFDVDTRRSDFARAAFAEALKHELLLRPIGNTVYFMPPYVTTDAEFAHIVEAALKTIDAVA